MRPLHRNSNVKNESIYDYYMLIQSLNQVKINDNKSGREYKFPCHRWLAKDEGDKKISVELENMGRFIRKVILKYTVKAKMQSYLGLDQTRSNTKRFGYPVFIKMTRKSLSKLRFRMFTRAWKQI